MSLLATWASRTAGTLSSQIVTRIPTSEKTIYLTLDDGPSRSTGAVLDLLAQNGATATFFVVGSAIEMYPHEMARIVEGGHQIGNHSMRHLNAWKHDWATISSDLTACHRKIESIAGESSRWLRPPYGRIRPTTLSLCREMQQRLALWDVMVDDFKHGVPPARIAKQVCERIRTGSVLVLHDGDQHQPGNLDAIELVLNQLSKSGWSIRHLPE